MSKRVILWGKEWLKLGWTNYDLGGYAKCIVQNTNGYTTYTDGMPVTATQLYYAVGNYGRTMTREQANAYPSGQKTYLYGDSTNGGILIDRTNTSYTRLKINYGDGTETTLCEIWDYNNGFGIFCGINEDTKKGTIYGVGNHGTYYYPIAILNSEKVYNVLNPTPSYNWQSVTSISGKNGILNLSQIKASAINDGEAVTGASASAFDVLTDDTLVANLISVGEIDNSKARVVYNIPALTSGSYAYAKLTYKQNRIPTDKDDGTSVDLDTTTLGVNKTIDVSGLIDGSIYWFVIFTDKSESDPVQLGQGSIGSKFFELDLSTDGRDIVRYDEGKTIMGAYQGQLVGVSTYTIEDGVITTAGQLNWYYDGYENPKSIPADCTLYFEYDVLFPNGEGFLDWYVIDSNGDERIYWCFDTKHAFQAGKWYKCQTICKVVDGKIKRYKYVLDGVEVFTSGDDNIDMPCTDTPSSLAISRIYFSPTKTTQLKNMSIYYDFSEYHDGGGSGSGSSGGA